MCTTTCRVRTLCVPVFILTARHLGDSRQWESRSIWLLSSIASSYGCLQPSLQSHSPQGFVNVCVSLCSIVRHCMQLMLRRAMSCDIAFLRCATLRNCTQHLLKVARTLSDVVQLKPAAVVQGFLCCSSITS